MSSRRVLVWFVPAALAAVMAVTLLAGFALALTGRFGEALAPLPAVATPTPSARRDVFQVVAIGDSIGFGVGDPSGGYAARVAAALRTQAHDQGQNQQERKVRFTNLAVSGHETGDVLRVIAGAEASRRLQSADLILLSAAGNDLSHGLRSLRGEELRLPETALAQAQSNLTAIFRRLRTLNPNAVVRALGIYNPFEIAAGAGEQARALLLQWNSAIEAAALPHPGVVVVPIADLFVERPDRLAGDRYHPGPKGHEQIAARVVASLPELP